VVKPIRVDAKSLDPFLERTNGKSQSDEESITVVGQEVHRRAQDSEFQSGLLNFEQAIEGQPIGTMPISKVLETAVRSVGADSGSLFILDDKGNFVNSAVVFRNEVQENQNGELIANVKEGLAGWVLRNGHPAIIPKTREDSRWRRSSWEIQDDISRSALSVPVLSNNEVCGALTVSHPQEGQFTDEHLALLGAMVAMLAINGGVSKSN
jgi:transcriptional regulator with GAF, ATPase, and Fis domain